MRWPLFVVALIVGFFFWDHFANDGAYMADLKRFSWDTSGDWKPPTITFNWDLPKR
ncbi:hypothetical protein [Mesorhizobium sp.]|uniref:hypothetical protein n=1 Tax=Mesorhizobium sp. TaxID=1871066 RepID=UPI0025C2EC6D|nr:hypothetical protein [Mesorhizobium sp.]